MKNFFIKIKNILFSTKKRIIITTISLLLISFGVGYLVLADENYDDFYTITGSSITVEDGSGSFDTTEGDGNDINNSNKIVRNFDSINYKTKFTLSCKEGKECPETATRSVEVHIWVKSNIVSSVSQNIEGSNLNIDDANDMIPNYTHYVKTIENVGMNVPTEVELYAYINAKNGDEILPIIAIKEATDTSVVLTDVNMNFTGTNLIKDTDKVTVTAKDRVATKLFSGTKTDVKKDEGTAGTISIPVGIALYIPNDSTNPDKGIMGAQVPASIDYTLNIKYSVGDGTITYVNKGNYTNDEDSKYIITNLPVSYDGNNGQNANIGYEDITATTGYKTSYKLKFTDMKYNTLKMNLNEGVEDAEEENVSLISTNIFVIKSAKSVYSDAEVQFDLNGESVKVLDNYEPFVGSYENKIDFIDSSNFTTTTGEEIKYSTPGQAIYNYNEEFYIQNYINYGTTDAGGDVLEEGLTNYIKVDNNLVQLISIDDAYDYYVSMNSTEKDQNKEKFSISFGVGEWDSSKFKLKDNAPSYCKSVPTTIDDLMNSYGGPCIEETENSITWVDNLSDLTDVQKGKVILVKYVFSDKYYQGTSTTIRLKAQAVNDSNNIWKTSQVVSRGLTSYNGETFYLSETARVSVDKQESDITYTKSIYDVGSQTFTSDTPTGKFGNTFLISPFKAKINNIIVLDSYDSEKDEIYSGITDPLTIKINTSLNKSDFNATFTDATIAVYLPSELELDIQKGDKVPNSLSPEVVSIEGKNYNKYVYSYKEEDIKYGEHAATIDNLNIHAYIDISTQDYTSVKVIAEIAANMKSNKDAVTSYTSSLPVTTRIQNKELTLRNTKIIGTIGKVAPAYFEKNGSVVYNMRTSNISGGTADLSLLKILPYSGDDLGDGTSYNGTLSVKINEVLPNGYKVYYTKVTPKNIFSNEIGNSGSLNQWTMWTNYNVSMSGVTAIKITGPKIDNNAYFGSKNGISLTITTNGNMEGDEYYNNFYILQNGVIKCEDEVEGRCTSTNEGITPYASNIAYFSVYNREISGSVFEDYNYDGLYSSDEIRLSDIPIEVYKLSNVTINDKKDTINLMSENDELVGETITSKNGTYKVKGLSQGNYYVKYTFDCEKYTTTEKNKQDLINLGDASDRDSDASMIANTCTAVSNIITVDNNNVKSQNIDLGLRVRQNFDVSIKKYITNVTVNSTKGTTSYDYDNATKVKLDVKNLRNTSFRVTYKFVIENSKYFPGTIGQIVESIPDGMTFDPKLPENDGWYMSGDYLYYSKYSKTYILPDEKYYMTIVLDLKTDNGGDYVNIVAAQDLKIMDTTESLLDGILIADYNSELGEEVIEDEKQEVE